MRSMLTERIQEFELKYCGLRSAARHLGVSASYLGRLRDGLYDKPSEKLLKKLGLKREVKYVQL